MDRPGSLHEVVCRKLAGEAFDPLVREFLDRFYGSDNEARAESISREPATTAPVHDAYLAAVAEHLALSHEMRAPAWTEAPGRFLKTPFFAGGLESLKATLIVESPLAFRRRLIFVSANALSRPRDTRRADVTRHVPATMTEAVRPMRPAPV